MDDGDDDEKPAGKLGSFSQLKTEFHSPGVSTQLLKNVLFILLLLNQIISSSIIE